MDCHPGVAHVRVTLHGRLALTDRGHQTDRATIAGLAPLPSEIDWCRDSLDFHPNEMRFAALDAAGHSLGDRTVFSIGGDEL